MSKSQMLSALCAAAALSASCAALAKDQVWKYVDEQTGQTIFSSQPLKGKKGEKLETLDYPPPARSQYVPAAQQAGGYGAANGIPADLLRSLALPPMPQSPSAAAENRPPLPPSSLPATALPPLPGSQASMPAPAAAQVAPVPSGAPAAPAAAVAAPAPAPAAAPAPKPKIDASAFKADPFSGK